MTSTVKLNVESKYGYSGQYIARITGRAERVQFAREFVGSKFGKRNECTSYETDEIGLYEECDVDKRGKQKSYALVLPWRDGLIKLYSDSTDALAIAKRLDAGEHLEDFVVVELGDVVTESQTYKVCATCERELADTETCREHEGQAVSYRTRQIPVLKDDGTPKHKIVYVIRKAGEVKKEQAAATLDAAVNAIVAALQALPAPQQKKALALAKEQLFPKAELAPEA